MRFANRELDPRATAIRDELEGTLSMNHDTLTIVAADTTVGNPVANIGIFGLFVAITMIIVIRAQQEEATAAEFFTGGQVFHRPAERHRDRR